ncbi:MAG: Ig-like domain-containing protein [Bacteroidales bacterium]|nr:Ig-like domain-containing protein [Bacteroidales bacterium]
MNKHVKLFSLLVAVLVFTLVGCIKDSYYDTYSLLQSKIELKVGDTYQLSFGYDAGYPTGNSFFGHQYSSDRELQQQGYIYDESRVLWKCSDTSVATVSASGLVTAIAVGECNIVAYYGDGYDVCHVVVLSDGQTGGGDEPEGGFTDYGAVSSLFSVASGKQVRFSRGNLQYQASTDTWRFAEQQYVSVGSDNANAAAAYTGWIDLFGWGTSGWNSGATAYLPYATNTDNADYYPGGDASNDLLGDNDSADWGRFNAIAAGGDQVGKWRTLTSSEWNYLLGSSAARQGKSGKAVIDGTYNGIVLLPDNWVLPSSLTFTPGVSSDYSTNAYTAAQWSAMEDAGAVFIPAAGFRDGTTVSNVGTHGYYWSSTHINGTYAYDLYFFGGYANASDLGTRAMGRSVRLVIDK